MKQANWRKPCRILNICFRCEPEISLFSEFGDDNLQRNLTDILNEPEKSRVRVGTEDGWRSRTGYISHKPGVRADLAG